MRKVYFAALMGMTLLGHPASAHITKQLWGTTPDGRKIDIYTLSNARGMQVQVATYSGTIVSIRVPDRNGNMADVVMSHPDLESYLKEDSGPVSGRYGEVIGRFANRIMGAQFTLNGKTYHLVTANNAKDQLHGGPKNLSAHEWTAKAQDGAEPKLTLTVHSPDGDQGFPGNLTASVTYTLMRDDALRLDYRATTDAPTVVNLTNHSYFNLKGEGDVSDEIFQILASHYTPSYTDSELRSVAGTPYDFTQPTVLKTNLAKLAAGAPPAGAQAGRGGPRLPGYDNNMVIDGRPGQLRIAARVEDPSSGRTMEVWTSQPGLQFFTPPGVRDANFVQRGFSGYAAFAMETEHFPNAPNIPAFLSTEVTPQKPLHEVTVFRFGTDKNPLPAGPKGARR